jgi:hypothetical protein
VNKSRSERVKKSNTTAESPTVSGNKKAATETPARHQFHFFTN